MGHSNSKVLSGASCSAGDSGYEEAVVCRDDDLRDGEMKEVEIDGRNILLVKDKGQFYAIGSKCTHYGAPLGKGALCDGRVRCPWHGACFDIKTGDIEDYPGVDSLHTYEVSVNDGHDVKVRVNKSLKDEKRVKVKCRPSKSDKRKFLIVGAGAAGFLCAETLRQNGYAGEIVMVTKEDALPYDRPKLSKALDTAAEALYLRKSDDYQTYGIKVLRQTQVSGMDLQKKAAILSNGKRITFDKALIATGGCPQTLDVPGGQLDNVFVLRTSSDANRIAKESNEKNVVIIGTSFIGLEVASYLSSKSSSVTVVGRSSVPLENVLGAQVGSVVQKLLEEKGIKFIFNNSPKEFIGKNEKISNVLLKDDQILDAEVCILGIGVKPETSFLNGSGLETSAYGYILVDKHMKTSVDGVYAAGDIVKFPLFLVDDAQVNVQHWQMASVQGKVAAENMIGRTTEVESVPFFWTTICGKSLRYAGYSHGYDDVVIHGDLEEQKFVAFYTKDDRVVAVASLNFDPVVGQVAEMMRARKVITKTEIQSDALSWVKRLNE